MRRCKVGCRALNDHGNYIIDHGKIMEKSWNFVFEFLWEPCDSIRCILILVGMLGMLNIGNKVLLLLLIHCLFVLPLFVGGLNFVLVLLSSTFIGLAHITPITHLRNKNSSIQGRPSRVAKVIFHTIRNCSQRKEFASSGSKFIPLREVPTLKRDAIEENHCLIQ